MLQSGVRQRQLLLRGQVEVQGKVRNLEQRRRVVMLVESTTGVEGVRDLLVESEK